MIYLGINQDRYDSGVTLTDGEHVLYAANEERFTRKKTQGGFPYLSLAAAFEQTGVRPADVGALCSAGLMTPPLPLRAFPALQQWVFRSDRTGATPLTDRVVDWIISRTPLAHSGGDSMVRSWSTKLLPVAVRRVLGPSLRHAPLSFVEHHRAHAFAAWALSGFDAALALTLDWMGDACSATVSRCGAGGIERLWSAGSRDSLGHFYEMITAALGFIPSRHEGKVTGLAAAGEPGAVREPSPFQWQGDRLCYHGPFAAAGVRWARAQLVAHHRREDVARWAQDILESTVKEIAVRWLERTGLRRMVVAGGVFANVKLNLELHQLPQVEELFVCPNMGDGGLSLGALAAAGGLSNTRVADVFWGDRFEGRAVEAALRAAGVRGERLADIDERIGALVAEGNIVGVFRDRMEWGPRALGNRSVLAPSFDGAAVQRLNRLLRRDDFMPFAPAIIAEQFDEYVAGAQRAAHAAELMTTCFAATDKLRCEHPAVVHLDGTVRAQLVRQATNPRLHAVLRAVQARRGSGVVLNTSFNIHEEPIVRTPAEAITAFQRAGLDYLAIDDYLVAGSHRANGQAPP